MRKWMGYSLALCLALSGCKTPSGEEEQKRRNADPEVYGIPAPYSAQDQDTGIPFQTASPPTPIPSPPPSPAPSRPAAPSPEVLPTPDPPSVPSPAAPQPSAGKSEQPAATRQERNGMRSDQTRKTAAGRSGAAISKRSFTLAELRHKYSQSFIFQGNTKQKRIALTFDDAPDTVYTPQVLDILRKHRVKATFFVVGCRAAKHPEVVKRIIREGHIVGNHSYGHSLMKKLAQPKFIQEIEKTERVLTPLTGYKPRLVRPPYGAINDEELAWLTAQGYLTVNWNVDPEDWRGVPKDIVLQRSLDGAAPGAIILMHCGTGEGGSLKGTVEALPQVIESLRGRGFELVPLTVLLGAEKGK